MRKFLSQLLDSDQDDSYLLAFALLRGTCSMNFPGADGRLYKWLDNQLKVVEHPAFTHLGYTTWYLIWPLSDGLLMTHVPRKPSKVWRR